MSITINIHPEEFRVRFYPGAGAFTTIDLTGPDSSTALILNRPAQCDELIAAATEAKRLLAEAAQLYVVVESNEGRLTTVTDPKPKAEAQQWARDNAWSFAGTLGALPADQVLDDTDGDLR